MSKSDGPVVDPNTQNSNVIKNSSGDEEWNSIEERIGVEGYTDELQGEVASHMPMPQAQSDHMLASILARKAKGEVIPKPSKSVIRRLVDFIKQQSNGR